MSQALSEAELAAAEGEVPVGAVIVIDGVQIAQARNAIEASGNPLAHAELLAISRAVQQLGDQRLTDATLYVTVEPCPMCAGAILQARLARVVYGTQNALAGCAGSVLNLLDYPGMNRHVPFVGNILEQQCRALVKGFFSRVRD